MALLLAVQDCHTVSRTLGQQKLVLTFQKWLHWHLSQLQNHTLACLILRAIGMEDQGPLKFGTSRKSTGPTCSGDGGTRAAMFAALMDHGVSINASMLQSRINTILVAVLVEPQTVKEDKSELDNLLTQTCVIC